MQLGSKAIAVPITKLKAAVGGDSAKISANVVVKEVLQRGGAPSSLSCLVVDGAVLDGDDCLLDIWPEEQWTTLKLEVQPSAHGGESSTDAMPPPPTFSSFGASSGGGRKSGLVQSSSSSSPAPAGLTASLTSSHLPASRPSTAAPSLRSAAPSLRSAGAGAAVGPFTWMRCHLAEAGFPVLPFPELSVPVGDTTTTVADLHKVLRVLHGFRADDAHVEVVVASECTAFPNNTITLHDAWDMFSGDTRVGIVYYSLSRPGKTERLMPCAVKSERLAGGAAASRVASRASADTASLIPLADESTTGLQLLFGALRVLERRLARADTDAKKREMRLKFLANVHAACQCPALVAALNTFIDDRDSVYSRYVAGFVALGLHTLFTQLLAPARIDPKEVLNFSRECVGFLLTAAIAPGSVAVTSTFGGVFCLHNVDVVAGNLLQPGAPHSLKQFVLLSEEDVAASDGASSPSSTDEDLYDYEVLQWKAQQAHEVIFGIPAPTCARKIARLQPDGRLRAIFLARTSGVVTEGMRQSWSLVMPLRGVQVESQASRVLSSKNSKLVTLPDLDEYCRKVDSSDFEEGSFRILNPRSLKSQKTAALFVRSNGTLGLFTSLSKEQSKFHYHVPIVEATQNEDQKTEEIEAESNALDLWLKGNSSSYFAKKLASKSSSSLPSVEDSRPVTEAIVILFDKSGSMSERSAFPALDRVTLCRQTASAFLNRLNSYDLPFRAQLTAFNSKTETLHKFTSLFSRVEVSAQSIVASGTTSLFEALVGGCSDLVAAFPLVDTLPAPITQATAARAAVATETGGGGGGSGGASSRPASARAGGRPASASAAARAAGSQPSVKRRLFVLSDGEDSGNSSTSPLQVVAAAHQAHVVIDAVCIGEEGNFSTLKAICLATGGLCLKAHTTEELFHYFEAEPMLSLSCRPQAQPLLATTAEELKALSRLPFSTVPKKPLPALWGGNCMSAAEALVKAQQMRKGADATAGSGLTEVFRAVLRSLAAYNADEHPNFKVYPSDDSIMFWTFIMDGAESTPYEGGRFIGCVEFPDTYPIAPPLVRMITPIYHCNINADGKVCHSVFDRNWNRHIPMRRVFDLIFGLLLAPEASDPLDTMIASAYYKDRSVYERTAREWTARHAQGDIKAALAAIAPISDAAASLLQSRQDYPEELIDPLSGTLLEDPVLAITSGITYSRKSIEALLRTNGGRCPKTGKKLTAAELVPNLSVKKQADAFRLSLDQAKKGGWWAVPM